MTNISAFSDIDTANTRYTCALQRAENLSILGVSSVLELMCGPSLRILEIAYKQFNITVTGNDIDFRWQRFYPQGKWLMGDAVTIDKTGFDAIVIAPPLSKGCSGRREDSLPLDAVTPSYYHFVNSCSSRVTVYVLPGRTLSVKNDREKLYKFLSFLPGKSEVIPLKDKVTKYVDVYNVRENVSNYSDVCGLL